jgi:hypothetical protein
MMANKTNSGKAKVVKGPTASSKSGKAVGKPPRGAPTTDQDPKRRLGNFTGTGEAPRKGYRTSGINGPQKHRDSTKRAKKESK